jgi:hypothetical protein
MSPQGGGNVVTDKFFLDVFDAHLFCTRLLGLLSNRFEIFALPHVRNKRHDWAASGHSGIPSGASKKTSNAF